MSNGEDSDKDAEELRFWRLHATIGKLVHDRKRIPSEVADFYQRHIIDPPVQEAKALPVAKPVEKFALFVDFGIITVPDDYVHASWLATFAEQNREKFRYYNDNVIDANFPNPNRVLNPGDKLHVRAFRQDINGTTSLERMAFLVTQKAIYVGAQGVSLFLDQMGHYLPRGMWYESFDDKNRLWEDVFGNHWVPGVEVYPTGDFRWDLRNFRSKGGVDDVLLCFTEVEE